MTQRTITTDLIDAAIDGVELLTALPMSTTRHDKLGRPQCRDAKIMIIDDEVKDVESVTRHLKPEGFHNFFVSTDSSSALSDIRRLRPDLVLLATNMPQVSGLEILDVMQFEKMLQPIPTIVLTASNDPEIRRAALQLGASDFLAKPVDPSELLLRVKNVLAVKAYQDHLAEQSEKLEAKVRVRTQELMRSRQEAIHCLARAGEFRDDATGHHVTRVGRYSRILAEELGYAEPKLDLIEHASQLHDVGKIGIPDAILHKPGKLDPDEFDLMRTHCEIGRKIINPQSDEDSIRLANHKLTTHNSSGDRVQHSRTSPVLKLAAVIASTHHEKWDGSGYPAGMSGTQIPLEGRIVAVADVFDALSSSRPYKKAFPVDKCLQILDEGRGSHFDPDVLDAFFRRVDDILAIRSAYDEQAALC
jgi:putative two-component system response regulator